MIISEVIVYKKIQDQLDIEKFLTHNPLSASIIYYLG